MIDCVSVENMRLSDAYTIAKFVSSAELMYRAAYGVFKAIQWKGNIAIIVGSGNNGGDGFALACILKAYNYCCTVFEVSKNRSQDSAHFAQKAVDSNIPVQPFKSGCLRGYDIVVDCLLGTGFHGTLREHYRAAIEAINASDAYIVSVDINSGMNGDTGEADLAVISDLTVTIGYVKIGLILPAAGKYIKKLLCVDIGITLLKEQWKICALDESLLPGCFLCPDWLDMNVLTIK